MDQFWKDNSNPDVIEYWCIKNEEVELVEPVQMNIYQINTHRKDLRWLHFVVKQRIQKGQQVKDQQSHLSIFVAYLTSSTSPDIATLSMHDQMIDF